MDKFFGELVGWMIIAALVLWLAKTIVSLLLWFGAL